MAMREPSRTARTDAWRAAVVLPADGATVARSLSGGRLLVAHTGNAHLGLPVDRALLRDLRRAEAAAARPEPPRDSEGEAPRADLPEVVPFRHATSYTLRVSGEDVHLTLHAAADRGRPDVHVELRVDGFLVERLNQHRGQPLGTYFVLAVAWLVLVMSAFVVLPRLA